MDLWAGRVIRSTSVLVLLAVVGMFAQMLWVAAPLLSTSPSLVEPDAAAWTAASTEADVMPANRGRAVFRHWSADVIWSNGRIEMTLLDERDSNLIRTGSVVPAHSIDGVFLDPALRWMVVAEASGKISVYPISLREDPIFKDVVTGMLPAFDHIEQMPDGHGLLLWHGEKLNLWQVLGLHHDHELSLNELAALSVDAPIIDVAIAPHGHRIAISTTRETVIWQRQGNFIQRVTDTACAPYWVSDQLLACRARGKVESMWQLPQPGLDITPSLMFLPQQYTGYKNPELLWLSRDSDSIKQPKFSITPLLFGTLKAAFFTMIIAMPIGLGCAIYVGFFMSRRARARVKPAIEILESIPTVVLGAIAAIWLAPVILANLAGLITAIVVAMGGLAICAMAWELVPKTWYRREYYSPMPLLLFPLIVLLGYGGFIWGGVLEQSLPQASLTSWLEATIGMTVTDRNALLVGMAMGVAVLPTMFSVAEDAIRSVPRFTSEGSIALGATRWQSFTDVVLPIALPGLISAVMLGFGRALGETMVVLMVSGNTPIMEVGILEGFRSIAATLAIELPESAFSSPHYRVLFVAALALFVVTFTFNTLAEMLRLRVRTTQRQLGS